MGTRNRGKKVKSMKRQAVAFIGISGSLIIFIGLMVSYIIARNTIREADFKRLDSVTKGASTKIEDWIETNKVSITICKNYFNGQTNNDIRKQYLVDTEGIFEAMPLGMYIVYDESGEIVYPGAGEGAIPDDYDARVSSAWYSKAMNSNQVEFTDVYQDAATGDMCVTLAVKLDDKSAVVGTDMFLTQITDKLREVDLSENGVAVLVNSSNEIIASNNEKLIGKSFDEVYSEMSDDLKNGSLSDEYKVDGKEQVVASNDVSDLGWKLVVLEPKTEIMAGCYRIAKVSVVCLIICVIMLVINTILSIKHIMEPINNVSSFMQKVAAGDLRNRVTHHDKTEVGFMIDSVNESVSNINNVITETTSAISILSEEAINTKEAADKLNDQSKNNVQAIDGANQIVEEVASSANTVSTMAESVMDEVRNIAERGNLANGHLSDTVSLTNKGRDDIGNVSTKILEIKTSMKELSSNVKETEEITLKINTIIEVIQDIASQTDLLALNASIEAARAGESGKGFAVVAGEIKALAQNSADSVSNIAKLIEQVENIVGVIVEKTEYNVEKIEDVAGLATNSKDSFSEIFDAIQEVTKEITTILSSINEVEDNAQTLAAISEEQTAGAEQVLGTMKRIDQSTHESMVSIENVDNSMKALNEVVVKLQKAVEIFKI